MLRMGLIGSLYARPAVVPVRTAKTLMSNADDTLFTLDGKLRAQDWRLPFHIHHRLLHDGNGDLGGIGKEPGFSNPAVVL